MALRDLADRERSGRMVRGVSVEQSRGSKDPVAGGISPTRNRDSTGRVGGEISPAPSHGLIGLGLRAGHRANEPSQDPEKGRAGHLSRRAGGRLSRSSVNRRGGLSGRQAAALAGESRGPEDRAQRRQQKVARAGARRERGLSSEADSGSLEDFQNRVDLRSQAARAALIVASRAEEIAGAPIGPVGGRAAESAVES